jgi:hypothetical protein
MVVNRYNQRARRVLSVWAFSALGLAAAVFITGCPDTFNPPDDGNPPEQPAARIISPTASFGISLLDPPISVIYTVPPGSTSVTGYFVQVESSNPASNPVAEPVVIAGDLPAGANRVFNFDPQQAGVGFFRVGVRYVLGGRQLFVESQGVIQVQGSPNPLFLFPDQATTSVEQGADVFISFDTRDSDGGVHWRLFRLAEGQPRNVPPDQIGTQLTTGTGQTGSFTMSTTGLLPGLYQLGLSATDSGLSIVATVGRGEVDRVVTIPNDNVTTPMIRVVEPGVLRPPTIAISAPGSGDVVLFRDDPFTIRFEGRVLEAGAQGTIEVFRDADGNATNGFTSIRKNLPVSTKTLAFPTDAPEGTHFVGATIRDEINAPVTAYASGRIVVVRTVELNVTQPASPLPVPPGTPVDVAWSTNVPPSAGTIDVFAQAVDTAGQATGPEIPILTGAPVTVTSAEFTSNTSGRFQVTARINVRDGTIVTDTAPALVRFSSLPGILWLGSLAEPASDIEGAIFGGVNVEDNAGSAFASAGDLDGDGFDEFVIAARYGKPRFLNPSGIGRGEAYILYGGAGGNKLRGEFNLNSAGTSLLTGITVTGIPTIDDSDKTDGMSDVTQIPDADGDGITELAFGFPDTDSVGRGPLVRPRQFRRGGIVILSSQNSLLENPFAFTPVIGLENVGQNFSDFTITPTDVNQVIADLFQFDQGDPNAEPPVPPMCVEGSDDVAESIIGPDWGFISALACPRWEHVDVQASEDPPFLCIGLATACLPEGACLPTQPPAEGECPSRIFPPLPCGILSGFHPLGAIPGEPRGARVLGKSIGDKFGTSVAASNPIGLPGAADLIVSAPGRSATDGEVQLLGQDLVSGSGVAYLVENDDAWGGSGGFVNLPSPHQYMVDTISHCGDGRGGGYLGPSIAGQQNDMIQVIEGLDDFNKDGRDDFAIGAPLANSGNGRVYIAFRREEAIEGDYVLGKLGLHPQLPERLTGMLITSTLKKGLGESLASGVDFNGDGVSDLVIGAPRASNEVGEVIIVFGQTGIVTPEGGYNVEELLRDIRTADGQPVAVRIKGSNREQGLFGYNVANAGDVDGDGTNDLLIAAPHASPRFDPNPNDSVDELTTLGIDQNVDGVADEVPGDNRLLQAGLVYVVYGNNRLDLIRSCANSGQICLADDDCAPGESCTTKDFTVNIERLGHGQLQGFIIAGRRGDDGAQSSTGHRGDRIGGGDAGDTTHGGIAAKANRGRSHGMASAGDVDGDGRADILIGSILSDPRRDPTTQVGIRNGGEAYLIYGSNAP